MQGHDTIPGGRPLRPGPEDSEMPLAARCGRMTAIASEYRRAGPLTDEDFATLLLVDWQRYVHAICEHSVTLHIGRATINLWAEIDPRDIRSKKAAQLNISEVLVARVRDEDERAECLERVLVAFGQPPGADADLAASDILTDLWTWCLHREIPNPTQLLPKVELLRILALSGSH